jgi:hypothetical protein
MDEIVHARLGEEAHNGSNKAPAMKLTLFRVEKSNVAAANPEKVIALQKRANELAATMAKPLLLQAEFGAMRERLHMPPALPGEEASFNEED